MSGSYHLLPPFKGEIPTAKWGTISFRKLGEKPDLWPPTDFDSTEDDVEIEFE